MDEERPVAPEKPQPKGVRIVREGDVRKSREFDPYQLIWVVLGPAGVIAMAWWVRVLVWAWQWGWSWP